MQLSGQRLKAARASAGLSQERLAAKAGVSTKTVRRLEHDRSEPALGTLRKLADALGVPTSALLVPEGEGVPA